MAQQQRRQQHCRTNQHQAHLVSSCLVFAVMAWYMHKKNVLFNFVMCNVCLWVSASVDCSSFARIISLASFTIHHFHTFARAHFIYIYVFVGNLLAHFSVDAPHNSGHTLARIKLKEMVAHQIISHYDIDTNAFTQFLWIQFSVHLYFCGRIVFQFTPHLSIQTNHLSFRHSKILRSSTLYSIHLSASLSLSALL